MSSGIQRCNKFNSLPKDKYFNLTNFKVFADDELNCSAINDFFSCDKVETIAGKGENAGSQHFLLIPQCFLTLSLLSRERHDVEKNNNLQNMNLYLTIEKNVELLVPK